MMGIALTKLVFRMVGPKDGWCTALFIVPNIERVFMKWQLYFPDSKQIHVITEGRYYIHPVELNTSLWIEMNPLQ
jgi:hypothetical protein